MKQMKLYMPTLVYSEKDCVKNHSKELASLGTKALIVTGRHSSRVNGSLDAAMAALSEHGVPYVVFDEIEENPSVETVMKARELGLEEQVDFVLGIGGGSPMDACKAIALMITNPQADESILYQSVELPCMPVAAIPTTAGTGSEVTPYAILTLHRERTKRSISHKIFPKLALMDPTYLKTASRSCLVNTAVDALSHLVESYLNTNANSLNHIYSGKGLAIWSEIKEQLLNNQLTDADYEKLMNASMLGGMAIAHTGTSLPHGMSYAITYELGIPHGKAVGIFLSGYVACYKNQEDAEQVLKLLGFQSAEEFTQYLKTLLGDVCIDPDLLKRDVEDLLANQAKLANYPFEISFEELYHLKQ